jgi:hypothetical protein
MQDIEAMRHLATQFETRAAEAARRDREIYAGIAVRLREAAT